MALKQLHPGGVYKSTPDKLFRDPRGLFFEAFKVKELLPALENNRFVQCNISQSVPFTIRGLHFQHGSCGKLMRCLTGSIFQVCVDVRRGSKTLGEWVGTHLDAQNFEAVYVPPGFANGFMAKSDGATVVYEMTDYYDPEKERALRWNDGAVGIKWPLGPGAGVVLSAKDKTAPGLGELDLWRA
jgi:dTDP-4-dehydrorhamnose 3,5-epimerase